MRYLNCFHRFLWKLYTSLISLIVYIIGFSWSIHCAGETQWIRRNKKRPVIFAFWHGELFPLIFNYRRRQARVLVSESKDGELVARVIERMGFTLARGSSSRHGVRGILRLLHSLQEENNDWGITPDGPKGPRHEVQPGIVFLALKTGRPIIPIRLAAKNAIYLHSWDRFMIPLPFAHIQINIGPPFRLQTGQDISYYANILRQHLLHLSLDRVQSGD